MNIGFLWFDNDQKASVEAKVDRAVAHYKRDIVLCFVHPSMLGDGNTGFTTASGIAVKPSKLVGRNYIWLEIGVKK